MSFEIILAATLYFTVIAIITWLAYRVTHSLSDYILGGRRLTGKIAALSAGAADMSNWLMMALPGAILAIGLNYLWLPIGLVIGAYLNWLFIAKRLRIYTEIAGNAQTIPAYFHYRFEDNSHILRLTTAIIIVVFFTIYAAAGFVGGALLINSITDLSYMDALLIGAGVIVTYTAVGGFLAVSWIDFFQGSLMLFALVLVPITAFFHLDDPLAIFQTISSISPEKLDIWHNVSLIGIISLLAWGLGYFGQPHILVRFMAIRSIKEIPEARRIGISWMVLSLAGAVSVGFIGIVFFADQPLANPETVLLEQIKSLFHPFLIGVLFAAVISAIISTVSSQLIASASSLVSDIYCLLLHQKPSHKRAIWITRFGVLLMVLVALWIASDPKNSIFNIVSYAWAGLTAAFGPLIVLSLFWSRMTKNGAVAGMLVGAVTVLFWPLLKPYGGIWSVYEILPGFLFACIAIVIVSLLDKPPSDCIKKQFAEMRERIK